MAIPRLTGYGYGRAASFAMHAASLGSLAGMDLPEFGYHGESGAIRQPSGVHGLGGSSGPKVSAGFSRPGATPQLRNYDSSRAATLSPVNALAYQGQPRMASVPGMVGATAGQQAQARRARSDLWNQAKGALAPAPVYSTAGYRALSTPAPPPQLALPQKAGGPTIMGRAPAPGAAEPMSRSGLGTYPTVEKPPTPPNPWESAVNVLTGDWGEPAEPHPPTAVTRPVGGATPSTRAPASRSDAFAPAQALSSELFPGNVEQKEEPEAPGLPVTPAVAAVRSRRSSFNPNQGVLF